MDAATLQSRIYKGYGKASKRIGYMADLYRASTAFNPLAAMNKQTSFNVSYNAEDMAFGKPNKYGKATWYALFDGSLAQVGDYLVNTQDGTFFIAAMQTGLPILVVQCNRTATFYRQQQQTGVGALGYGGSTVANEATLATAWPCSILQGTKGEKNAAALPGDVRNPWYAVLVPAIPGVTFRTGDIIADDLSRRYEISSAELTDLGWRMTVAQAQT